MSGAELDHLTKALEECRAKFRRAIDEGGTAEDVERLKGRTESYVRLMLELAAEQPGNADLTKHIVEMLLDRDAPAERDDTKKVANGGGDTSH